MSWYVVQVYSSFEHKVAESLIEEIERKGLAAFFNAVVVPTEEVIELKRGAKIKVEKKLLPSYILVRMKLSDDTWHMVKSTARVIDFLGSGKVPAPISNREARRMLRMMQGVDQSGQSRAPRLLVRFSVGEQVRVSDGPFMSFNGVVEDVDEERARLKVSVTIFGRSTPVDLDYVQVDKI
ncbi:MAG: transcription termination/antitermination protein NusG [Alphaproteobacteria bacterium]|nr:transcription termination/antitermination protein NusG [Alphaproteobacteria bacterium]